MNSLRISLIAIIVLLSTVISSAQSFVGERSDFRDETIYFAMTTRFYDGDPKNNVLCWDNQQAQIADRDPAWRGDFKGLIDKLDYIKALGFTAIWITPVVQNASGYDYHGYHAMDLTKVDLRYESHRSQGSADDVTFQSLIDATHAKGMKIILDIVLNHTGNFGEATLCPMFKRDQRINNQASPEGAMHVNEDLLGSDYNSVSGSEQYQRRLALMKNTRGNKDVHNYWHHVGNDWNWDYPSRWWGQIAGDCVDLNTENQAVSDYLVKCYGEFIKMGVDGFRIDTTGHISRLTFNKSFIPQFIALGEQYKDKRLNGCPFYMFGEVCSRYSEVTYRDQPNLSSYFYTWKSPQASLDTWNTDASWWDNQVVAEGAAPLGNMLLCIDEPSEMRESNNVFMINGAWHEPDYSDASGFNVIDFPMHYNFNNASAAINIANQGDKLYNDASFNVVYVDSHDYCPGPNDGVRFNGGTAQWAENLSLMFTFRGIPCIYYGSEVEFQKGLVIDKGPNIAMSQTGRAYFGHYLEGEVTASDFGSYTASGNVAQTLNADLAQHIIRLNQIRASVPALRKGQYTFEGCTARGGWAFKRAYKDSYALIAINGGATFSGVPEGTYTDIITGKTYQSAGTLSIDAPTNQGQLRVLVKDWTSGKVGEDGKFIYASSPVSKGDNVTFSDPGTEFFYTPDDVVGSPAVTFSPAGSSFRTETLTVTASLNEVATTGWYQVDGGEKTELTAGSASTFVIGEGAAYGSTINISWEATDEDNNSFTGYTTYTKTDPKASITIYVAAPSAPNLYAWASINGKTKEFCGSWPGVRLTDKVQFGDDEFYYHTFADVENINIIFNNNGAQTADITGITNDTFFSYDGVRSYSIIESPSDGVESTVNDNKITVSVHDGSIYINSTQNATITISNIAGATLIRQINSGTTVIDDLPHGFYIINHIKVLI